VPWQSQPLYGQSVIDDDVAAVPAELVHLLARHRQERRRAEARSPVPLIAGDRLGGAREQGNVDWGVQGRKSGGSLRFYVSPPDRAPAEGGGLAGRRIPGPHLSCGSLPRAASGSQGLFSTFGPSGKLCGPLAMPGLARPPLTPAGTSGAASSRMSLPVGGSSCETPSPSVLFVGSPSWFSLLPWAGRGRCSYCCSCAPPWMQLQPL